MRVIDPDACRVERELKGWSQRQLAGLIGRSQAWVARFEGGQVSTVDPLTAGKLCRDLGLDLEQVFERPGRSRMPEPSPIPGITGAAS